MLDLGPTRFEGVQLLIHQGSKREQGVGRPPHPDLIIIIIITESLLSLLLLFLLLLLLLLLLLNEPGRLLCLGGGSLALEALLTPSKGPV